MQFFTSDTHFGHANIIKYDGRPFSSVEEHDEGLITNWNSVVAPGDLVYHLGDVCWHHKELDIDVLLARLHGTKILITGNHDLSNKHVLRSKQWAKVTPYMEVTINDKKICLLHYRMVVWNKSHYGSWALHGHSHGTLPVLMDRKTFDVGTMCWGYTPLSFMQVADEMNKRSYQPVDGHVARIMDA